MRRFHHDQIARIGQAMASPVRLRALNLLAQSACRVGDLARELGESVAATSAHLKVLRSAGMVVEERRGREHWLRVESPEIFGLLAAAQRAAEAVLPELREAARADEDDPFVLRNTNLRELADDVARDRVALVDLRPREEYRAGHLPGARSHPHPDFNDDDLRSLRSHDRLVAYCRGRWCQTAREGVAALNDRGLPARRLLAGVVDWRAEGLELVREDPTPENGGTNKSSNKETKK